MLESDAEIMAAFQAGDESAFDLLVESWQHRLMAFFIRSIGSREDALDLVQETLVRVYKQKDRYKEMGTFSSWIFRIASNLCRNRARWKARHPSVAGATSDERALPGEREADPRPSPDVTAEESERATAIRDAVQSLPPKLRTAVLLFEFEGMSQNEIGNVLDCSPKAVETRIYRARKILKKRLGVWAPSTQS